MSLMSMSCNRFLALGKVTPGVFLKACLLGAQKRIGDAHQADMVMPAQPVTALVMIQPQFLFQVAVIQLHSPAGSGDANPSAQPQGQRTTLSQPVFRRLVRSLRPIHQQPLGDARRMFLGSPTVGRPNLGQGEARAFDAPAALTPSHGAPGGGRPLLRYRPQILRSGQGLEGRILPRPK